jgi:hypothetical protein
MALSILDGNQSATTLSTILSSGQHITAHTVVSLGTQAITDMRSAVSGSVVSISSLPAISGTVTANVFGTDGYGLKIPLHMAYGDEAFADGRRLAVSIVNGNGEEYTTPLPISGTVSVRTDLDVNSSQPCVAVAFDSPAGVQRVGNTNGFPIRPMQDGAGNSIPLAISGTVTIGSALPAGTNQIGVVTIGAGTVTIGAGTAQIGSVTASISNFPATQAVSLTTLPALVAGTAQIGSVTASISNTVTASISGTVPISISSVTVGNSVTIGSLPALAAGTAQIGSVTASISANPSGALTTRFGSVTTANTAQITTAVTNTSRKYLFAQNISIGSVTMGIGFSPTTTQGIQLSAGSGIVFDSFCPTGAVYWLGATTGAAWSILEG